MIRRLLVVATLAVAVVASGVPLLAAAHQVPPPSTCSDSGCIEVPLVAKIADLHVPAPDDPPLATVQVEDGQVNVTGPGERASQDVTIARVDGRPDPAALDRSVGPVDVEYVREQLVCLGDPCRFAVDSNAEPALKVGELWEARLQVWVGDTKVTDQPFAAVVLL